MQFLVEMIFRVLTLAFTFWILPTLLGLAMKATMSFLPDWHVWLLGMAGTGVVFAVSVVLASIGVYLDDDDDNT